MYNFYHKRNCHSVDVNVFDTVRTLREQLARRGLPLDQQILVFGGRVLDDDATLWAQGIHRQSSSAGPPHFCVVKNLYQTGADRLRWVWDKVVRELSADVRKELVVVDSDDRNTFSVDYGRYRADLSLLYGHWTWIVRGVSFSLAMDDLEGSMHHLINVLRNGVRYTWDDLSESESDDHGSEACLTPSDTDSDAFETEADTAALDDLARESELLHLVPPTHWWRK